MRDSVIASFYRDTKYEPIWTGENDKERRIELFRALESAGLHGLPVARYDVARLKADLASVRSPRDAGRMEVAITRVFLQYARDIQSGALAPSEIDPLIVRDVTYREPNSHLMGITSENPRAFLRTLPPSTAEYNALMKQKLVLARLIAKGGWGQTVRAQKLEPGDSGAAVVALRDRLVRMGYLKRSARNSYDEKMRSAVIRFQADHGLEQDGIVGDGTLAEINTSAEARLHSIVVAMERERWLNIDRGQRHIEVNLTDFTAKIIDKGKITFQTRSVVGAKDTKRQSPEFSDVMEHMVINPTWFVPRSIATKEYLPKLKQNPGAVGHLLITDRNGRAVKRDSVDFEQYTARSFPYAMRQPPGKSNALGLVKFMFPNKYNIYLHDTPAKKLFAREIRAYSHGCIRLADPFDFAYALLAVQSDDPEGFFQSKLAPGKEVQVDLENHVPVHIIYRTARIDSKGRVQYRRDVYGRDARIWEALSQAGVALYAVQG
ncbi:MAG: L,D-transpeptidase family protein [Pseudomonadota bacterium]